MQRVIRLLTPAIFAPQWDTLSTVFIAGNADILNAIENVHFNLKGTPSASEIEFLSYLLEHHRPDPKQDEPVIVPQVKPSFEGLALRVSGESALPQLAERIEHYLDHALDDHAQVLERALSIVEQKAAIMSQRVQQRWHDGVVDEFATVDARELFEQMIANVDQPAWNRSLQRSFLGAFVRHQPQYRPEACVIASGSSRTALGIVGFHCGITDVVIPDLSWSYEQCFPNVHAVPLTPTLELDADGLIAKIEELCVSDPTLAAARRSRRQQSAQRHGPHLRRRCGAQVDHVLPGTRHLRGRRSGLSKRRAGRWPARDQDRAATRRRFGVRRHPHR